MNQKELTKTFMMIKNLKNLSTPWFIQKYIGAWINNIEMTASK